MEHPRYRILTDAGELMRVTVEHGVTNRPPLVKLQQYLSQHLPGFHPKDPDDFHLTLFHFGQPEVLYKELEIVNPQLSFVTFLEYFYELMDQTAHVIPEKFEIQTDELAKFGNPQSPTVVVTLQHHQRVYAEHHRIAAEYNHFLHLCGVHDADDFMQANNYLMFQRKLKFHPHVSPGRLEDDAPLPHHDVTGLVIGFTPSRLRNVEVLH